jgi:hypothetical protein
VTKKKNQEKNRAQQRNPVDGGFAAADFSRYALRNQKRPDLFPFDNPLDLRYRVATDNTRKVYELRTPLPSRTARLP